MWVKGRWYTIQSTEQDRIGSRGGLGESLVSDAPEAESDAAPHPTAEWVMSDAPYGAERVSVSELVKQESLQVSDSWPSWLS